ncbi:BTAD domain-containing putative transcriptional regulator [Amycolatopsis sp. NPDC051061]|uniref:AfsR/SARP family transcriptional regulator n=1 Tax=Amycolatopsis sp. NPDC051061 TaxID=3155042 RepID=UPI00343B590B
MRPDSAREPDAGYADGPWFQVLGPFELRVRDRALELGGFRIRTLLALLTANAGRRRALATEPSAAAEHLTAALAVWRGDAYAEFPQLRAEATRLHGLRLGAIEDRVDAELTTGAGPVEELTGRPVPGCPRSGARWTSVSFSRRSRMSATSSR